MFQTPYYEQILNLYCILSSVLRGANNSTVKSNFNQITSRQAAILQDVSLSTSQLYTYFYFFHEACIPALS
jgi:hypothetical protein